MAQKLLNAAMLFKDHVFNKTAAMYCVMWVMSLQLICSTMTTAVKTI